MPDKTNVVLEPAVEPIVEKAFYIDDFRGFDFLLQLGTNAEGERVLRQQMRAHGTLRWFPMIEMLVEFDNYWKDTNSGFKTEPKQPPPPPPEG